MNQETNAASRSSFVLPALILALAFAAMSYISLVVFHNFPFSMDEYNNDYQAEIFAQGKTHLEVPEALAPLKELYMVHQDEKLFSKYAPGYALLLAAGKSLGIPAGLVNPLLSVVTLLLVFLIAKELTSEKNAILVLALLAFNPYFLG